MGCEFEVLLNERQYPNGVECAAEALSMIEQMESLLSVYRPQSQISKVNQFAATHPVLVDVKTMELVQLAVDVHQWTGGAFDITGQLGEAWGLHEDRDTCLPPSKYSGLWNRLVPNT